MDKNNTKCCKLKKDEEGYFKEEEIMGLGIEEMVKLMIRESSYQKTLNEIRKVVTILENKKPNPDNC